MSFKRTFCIALLLIIGIGQLQPLSAGKGGAIAGGILGGAAFGTMMGLAANNYGNDNYGPAVGVTVYGGPGVYAPYPYYGPYYGPYPPYGPYWGW